jgi:hypothetical protein
MFAFVLPVEVNMSQIPGLLAELADVPDEGIALALADAIFHLGEAPAERIQFCISEAEVVRARLRKVGFDITSVSPA